MIKHRCIASDGLLVHPRLAIFASMTFSPISRCQVDVRTMALCGDEESHSGRPHAFLLPPRDCGSAEALA